MTYKQEVKLLMGSACCLTMVTWATVQLSTRDRPPNVFHKITIAELPTFRLPHAEITGRVTISRREDDGDWHIRLVNDAGNFIVAEIIPELPRLHPRLQTCITVQGITRFDKQHQWYEIHPLIKWWEVSCSQ